MQNLPRIYLNENLEPGKVFPLSPEQGHYLSRVMRVSACPPNDALRLSLGPGVPKQSTDNRAESIGNDAQFLVFNNGKEFYAKLIEEKVGKKSINYALCSMLSNRPDPSGRLVLAFAPIKQPRAEELIAMATQLGIAKFIPVITERTTAPHLNWERLKKIAIEASEQSGRNSIPEIMPEIKFADLIKNKNIIFADERFAHCPPTETLRVSTPPKGGVIPESERLPPWGESQSASEAKFDAVGGQIMLIGPEGGFSPAEFDALDQSGATGISLGPTILRAETAAIVAIAKVS